MGNCQRLKLSENVDIESECFYNYVYGAQDRFNLHCHTFFEIFITVTGTVTHRINGVTQKLPEGSLVFIRPDDEHGYIYSNASSCNTEYVNLTFTCETVELLFQYLSEGFPAEYLLSAPMPPTVILNGAEKKRILAELDGLNAVNWQDKRALKLRMRAILADIFTRHFGNASLESENLAPVWLTRLVYKMEQPENFTAGTERMIALSGKSREHLSRTVKKYYGVTLTEFVNGLTLNYAANLLINTNKPILDICFLCGFQNVSWFYRIFKEKYGLSPGNFRKVRKLQ